MSALTGLSQSFLSMLEAGSRQLNHIDKIVDFLAGLGAPNELVRLPLPAPSRGTAGEWPSTAGDSDDPADPWTANRMVEVLERATKGREMERRKFLAVSGATLTAYVHHWGVADAEPLERVRPGSAVTPGLLRQLQATTDHLRTMDAGSGSGSLADLGRAHLGFLSSVLKHGRYSEAEGRQLAAITADTATQTGWFTFDAGKHDRAQSYFLAALRAAHASGDVRLGAGALSYLAIHGYSTGHPRDGVAATRAALEKVSSLETPALKAMLLTRQARSHAKLGERQAALKALGRAGDLYAKGRSDHDPEWLYWINEGEIHGQSGSCHLDLDDPAGALASFQQARSTLNPDERRTRALVLTREATAHFRTGDAEAGAAAGNQALAMARDLQSARLDEHLHTLAAELDANPAPYAQELKDAVSDLARTET
ncbi:XRE family transcriptional regulator [Streptomyces sp. NPDC060194]|uniref:XRE family transcriptional regulator n=1 Tax=Streptomyces sp. NPDC060194 TaxID=3347069 RepID=UPI00365C6AD0